MALGLNEAALAAQRNQAGRFILATILQQEDSNGLQQEDSNRHQQEEPWPNDEILQEYKNQQSCENGFHRFKRGQLPALPIYLANEDRIIGLMFLLTIALRCFTLIEFQVRRQLQIQQQELAGLYAGNPKRKTKRPTAEQLLKAFGGITLYHHRDGASDITPLNDLQRHILTLMKIPETIYALPVQT